MAGAQFGGALLADFQFGTEGIDMAGQIVTQIRIKAGAEVSDFTQTDHNKKEDANSIRRRPRNKNIFLDGLLTRLFARYWSPGASLVFRFVL